MSRVLIIGDSQAGNPGAVAERKLQSLGHTTQRIFHVGKGPYDYVRLPDLWAEYTNTVASFRPDIILLIFGTNDEPNQHLADALVKLKQRVRPKVVMSGPPQYPDAARQANSELVKAIYERAFGADYIPSYPHTSPSLPRAADNLHFTMTGAQPWGTAMADDVHRRLSNPLPAGRV